MQQLAHSLCSGRPLQCSERMQPAWGGPNCQHQTLFAMLAVLSVVAGLVKVASAVSAGYSSVEAREVELRTEINAALAKMRAYARDMEVRPPLGSQQRGLALSWGVASRAVSSAVTPTSWLQR